MTLRHLRVAGLAALLPALTIMAPSASATVTPLTTTPANATLMAQALAATPGQVDPAATQFTAGPGIAGAPASPVNQEPNGTGDNLPPLAGFPTNGPSYAIMTTGNAALADDPNGSGSTGRGNNGLTPSGRGTNARDTSTLKVRVTVPPGANCLSLDYRFLSEEFPEFVGTSFNDAFIAEVDNSTWMTASAEPSITAPADFATRSGRVSVNGVGPTAVFPSESVGTTYDAATGLVNTKTPITPGAHDLYFSVFDQGDSIYDSAVFLDRLIFITEPPETCQPPKVADAVPATPPTSGVPPVTPPPSNAFTPGSKVTFNQNGTAVTITVTVPGPGTVGASDASAAGSSRAGAAAVRKKPLIKPARVVATKAGPVKLTVKLSSAGKKVLKKKKKVRVRVKLTFTPKGGKPASKVKTITFKKPKPRRRTR